MVFLGTSERNNGSTNVHIQETTFTETYFKSIISTNFLGMVQRTTIVFWMYTIVEPYRKYAI